MDFLKKIKERLLGNNNRPPENQECAGADVVEEIDNTMIDAGKRIEKMLEEMR